MTMCGTPNYISPEVASRSSHGLEVDVWGLGCMLYTLLVGKPPFDTSEVKSTLTRVVMAKYELPSYLTAEAKDLIDSLLKKNPKDRIKLEQIPEHPFLKLYSTPTIPVHSRMSQDSGLHTMSSKRESTRGSVNSDCGNRRPKNEVCARRVNSDCSPVRYSARNGDYKYEYNKRSRSQDRNYGQDSYRFERYNEDIDKLYNLKLDDYKTSNDNCYIKVDELNNKQINNDYSRHSKEPSTCRPEQISLFSQNSACDNRHGDVFRKKCQHSCCSLNCQKADNVLDNLNSPINNYPVNDYIKPQTSMNEPKIFVEPPKPQLSVPQLCSFRLLPTRHRAKNAILTILDTGEICVEIIRKRNLNRDEVVKEVCLISPDGLRIVIFEPEKGRGIKPMDKPPPLPPQGADAIYSYENLPEKHWKKYLYAARFVDLVRAKTPKVTYYSPKAKFQLMENLKDYETYFYDGKISRYK